MDQGVALSLFEFPRPCFYKDLTELAVAGRLRSAIVLGDGAVGDLSMALGNWRATLPNVQITLVYPSSLSLEVSKAVLVATDVIPLAVMDLGDGLAETLRLWLAASSSPSAHNADIIVTCAPYDSYGVLVKRSLEAAILKIMRMTGAYFIIHDPAFRVARIYDQRLLADRLYARPRRIAVYRRVVRLLLLGTALLSRLPVPGWRSAR